MKSRFSFKGVISALPTPFLGGAVDYNSIEKMVHFQLQNGIDGFVVNGTTAESPTLTWPEVEDIFMCVKKIVGDSKPLILGTGSNSTAETVEKSKKAADLGADACLVVVPYYNKPPQRGLIAHFSQVAQQSKLPVIAYNVPGRTITGMSEETVVTLSRTENIIGIKEASGDIEFDKKLKAKMNSDFVFLSGDDPTYVDFLKLGGVGLISVMSNLLTAECSRWTKLAAAQKWAEVEADFVRYKKLIGQMYVEANPIPIKWMLYKKGIIASPEMRLPLVALDEPHHQALASEMKGLGLI